MRGSVPYNRLLKERNIKRHSVAGNNIFKQ